MNPKPQLFEDSRDLVAAFEETGAEYVVVGAHALAAHGLPRATADFDVLVRPSQENARRIMEALRAFGARVEDHGVSVKDFEQPGTVYQLGLPPRRIDVLTAIGRDALIKNKRATGREKDLLDVKALER